MKKRTKGFALQIIELVESLPNHRTCQIIGKQHLRSGTSVGANYSAASRAKSRADFISKMGIVEEEADESAYWMEILLESGKKNDGQLQAALKEANEILAIAVASIKTAKKE
ncbi:MAG TPA: four helix bundle protein [Bacteroidota bacterium]